MTVFSSVLLYVECRQSSAIEVEVMKVIFPIPVAILKEGPVQYNYTVYSVRNEDGVSESQKKLWGGSSYRLLHISPDEVDAGGTAFYFLSYITFVCGSVTVSLWLYQVVLLMLLYQ